MSSPAVLFRSHLLDLRLAREPVLARDVLSMRTAPLCVRDVATYTIKVALMFSPWNGSHLPGYEASSYAACTTSPHALRGNPRCLEGSSTSSRGKLCCVVQSAGTFLVGKHVRCAKAG